MHIRSEAELRTLYGYPKERARDKLITSLEQHSINFIQHSPFLTISTYGITGLVDSSPRGGHPGFVKILDEGCILIPEAKGNNRLDSLVNIVETGGVGCLFLIPGVDETLRINGTACISVKPEHLALFTEEQHMPKSCIEISIKEIFLHCAKALMRSQLWSTSSKIDRTELPTMGVMINDQLGKADKPESQEEMVKRYQASL